MVALLRGRELRGFLERTSGRFTVTVARSVSGFVLELEASFGGTCVFDPTELTRSAIADIAAAAARAGCALLLYVPLDTAVTEKALSVLDDVEAELVFAGIDDDPDIIALRCPAHAFARFAGTSRCPPFGTRAAVATESVDCRAILRGTSDKLSPIIR